jgi:hypothetical protein
MEDEKREQPDATNQDDIQEIDKILGGEGDADKKPNVDAQLLARAKKAEEEKKVLKAELDALKKPKEHLPAEDKDKDWREKVVSLELAEKKRQYGYEHNLSPKEVDYLFKINPNPDESLLEDEFIKGGLEAIRAKSRIESNTPSPSSRPSSFVAPKKENVTKEEKQEAFESFVKERFNK